MKTIKMDYEEFAEMQQTIKEQKELIDGLMKGDQVIVCDSSMHHRMYGADEMPYVPKIQAMGDDVYPVLLKKYEELKEDIEGIKNSPRR